MLSETLSEADFLSEALVAPDRVAPWTFSKIRLRQKMRRFVITIFGALRSWGQEIYPMECAGPRRRVMVDRSSVSLRTCNGKMLVSQMSAKEGGTRMFPKPAIGII